MKRIKEREELIQLRQHYSELIYDVSEMAYSIGKIDMDNKIDMCLCVDPETLETDEEKISCLEEYIKFLSNMKNRLEPYVKEHNNEKRMRELENEIRELKNSRNSTRYVGVPVNTNYSLPRVHGNRGKELWEMSDREFESHLSSRRKEERYNEYQNLRSRVLRNGEGSLGLSEFNRWNSLKDVDW